MENFWKNKEWLNKMKKIDNNLYEVIINSNNIEFDWETFSLIIDGVKYTLSLNSDSNYKSKITIIKENGKKTTYIR